MLSSKQRAYLKSIANSIDPVFQIGKGGTGDALISQIEDYLRAHEIIKVKVLENSIYTAKEAMAEISQKINAEAVTAIGSVFILYKKNSKEPKIILPR